jgi:Putative auto-transporter adhesin, head GIN domain
MTVTSVPHRGGHAAHRSQLAWITGLVAAAVLAMVGLVLVIRGSGPPGTAVQGSGIAAAQTRTVGQFSGLDLAGSSPVTVVVGAPQSVVVHADSNLLGNVTTRVASGTLVIATTGSFTSHNPMSVDVSVPTLTGVHLSGSGLLSVTGIKAPALTVTLSGSGILTAAGTVSRLDVTLDGSGQAQLSGLTASDAYAVLSGSGVIQLTATTSLNAAVPGSGAILYAGNPSRVTTSVTGSGTVMRG